MRSFLLAGAAVGLLLAACSSGSQPPALGSCKGGDSGCGANGSSGGGGSGGSGGSSGGAEGGGACTVDTSTSQCQQCAESTCCAEIETCGQDATCQMLLACTSHCFTQACVTSCEQKYNGTAPEYRALVSCLAVHCPVCAESGVGDPCSPSGNACVSLTTCSGLFCTRTCTIPADCDGIGPGKGNFTGQPGTCRHIASGYYCFPGCAGDQDCAAFPGTSCIVTTDLNGATVQVCASGPDAGTD